MKTNELKIGNCLFVPGVDREVIVSAIFKTHYVCEDYNGIRFDESLRINYQPIQLTEEWLLKFGFGWKNFAFRNGTFTVRFQKEFYVYLSIEGVRPIRIKLDYVHQLQNLYFALTGEELTYGGGEQ